ncbi:MULTISPECIES: sporulation peptidase YabG [unclassified Dehalobacter]|uniref:sporulation peptidase YabG n=1 Tax=unclassified Dehalobacter TaxID=2635733 RepID=UPI000E6C4AD3|nr:MULTISPECIES: sporulation peptidase YabG [unclassified Dehalobacter]RJE47809.1 sporulation peptidase YabG [Dehalobacter sp. MCB1]TCX49041.1 sporulation peptidase YabG [Dehalobacter sp. 14DCB1]TCX56638.1 sporulation peptidase YabG [Dehalobacter sp. 12DCB1]
MFKIGDIVARLSYNQDLFLKILALNKKRKKITAVLGGLNYRLIADSDVNDLVFKNDKQTVHYQLADSQEVYKKFRKVVYDRKFKVEEEYFEIPGKILHLDGDREYLDHCLRTYRQLGLQAKGICKSEAEQPKAIAGALRDYPADILVLTGHDSLLKGKSNLKSLDSYRSSGYFVQSVTEARRIQPNKDQLVVFAGGCQSNFEAIIEAGANFASSPRRMLIHALDPVFLVESIAYTPIDRTVSLKDIIRHTVTGADGVGGIETRGQLRRGYPKVEH